MEFMILSLLKILGLAYSLSLYDSGRELFDTTELYDFFSFPDDEAFTETMDVKSSDPRLKLNSQGEFMPYDFIGPGKYVDETAQADKKVVNYNPFLKFDDFKMKDQNLEIKAEGEFVPYDFIKPPEMDENIEDFTAFPEVTEFESSSQTLGVNSGEEFEPYDVTKNGKDSHKTPKYVTNIEDSVPLSATVKEVVGQQEAKNRPKKGMTEQSRTYIALPENNTEYGEYYEKEIENVSQNYEAFKPVTEIYFEERVANENSTIQKSYTPFQEIENDSQNYEVFESVPEIDFADLAANENSTIQKTDTPLQEFENYSENYEAFKSVPEIHFEEHVANKNVTVQRTDTPLQEIENDSQNYEEFKSVPEIHFEERVENENSTIQKNYTPFQEIENDSQNYEIFKSVPEIHFEERVANENSTVQKNYTPFQEIENDSQNYEIFKSVPEIHFEERIANENLTVKKNYTPFQEIENDSQNYEVFKSVPEVHFEERVANENSTVQRNDTPFQDGIKTTKKILTFQRSQHSLQQRDSNDDLLSLDHILSDSYGEDEKIPEEYEGFTEFPEKHIIVQPQVYTEERKHNMFFEDYPRGIEKSMKKKQTQIKELKRKAATPEVHPDSKAKLHPQTYPGKQDSDSFSAEIQSHEEVADFLNENKDGLATEQSNFKHYAESGTELFVPSSRKYRKVEEGFKRAIEPKTILIMPQVVAKEMAVRTQEELYNVKGALEKNRKEHKSTLNHGKKVQELDNVELEEDLKKHESFRELQRIIVNPQIISKEMSVEIPEQNKNGDSFAKTEEQQDNLSKKPIVRSDFDVSEHENQIQSYMLFNESERTLINPLPVIKEVRERISKPQDTEDKFNEKNSKIKEQGQNIFRYIKTELPIEVTEINQPEYIENVQNLPFLNESQRVVVLPQVIVKEMAIGLPAVAEEVDTTKVQSYKGITKPNKNINCNKRSGIPKIIFRVVDKDYKKDMTKQLQMISKANENEKLFKNRKSNFYRQGKSDRQDLERETLTSSSSKKIHKTNTPTQGEQESGSEKSLLSLFKQYKRHMPLLQIFNRKQRKLPATPETVKEFGQHPGLTRQISYLAEKLDEFFETQKIFEGSNGFTSTAAKIFLAPDVNSQKSNQLSVKQPRFKSGETSSYKQECSYQASFEPRRNSKEFFIEISYHCKKIPNHQNLKLNIFKSLYQLDEDLYNSKLSNEYNTFVKPTNNYNTVPYIEFISSAPSADNQGKIKAKSGQEMSFYDQFTVRTKKNKKQPKETVHFLQNFRKEIKKLLKKFQENKNPHLLLEVKDDSNSFHHKISLKNTKINNAAKKIERILAHFIKNKEEFRKHPRSQSTPIRNLDFMVQDLKQPRVNEMVEKNEPLILTNDSTVKNHNIENYMNADSFLKRVTQSFDLPSYVMNPFDEVMKLLRKRVFTDDIKDVEKIINIKDK